MCCQSTFPTWNLMLVDHCISFPTLKFDVFVERWIDFPTTVYTSHSFWLFSSCKWEIKMFTIPGNTCSTRSNLSRDKWLHHNHCWKLILVDCCIAFPTTACGLSISYTVSEFCCARLYWVMSTTPGNTWKRSIRNITKDRDHVGWEEPVDAKEKRTWKQRWKQKGSKQETEP